MLWTNGKALFFKGDICLRYDINTHSIDPGYPQKIAEGEWSILPESFLQGIDAGLVWNNGKAFFFRENEYIMIDLYKRQIEPGYPQKLDSGQWIGWPSHFYQGIDTAVLWDHGKAYFFKGSEYICYDIYREMVDAGYPKTIASLPWKGLPHYFTKNLDAAVNWNHEKAYFFKGDEYICYDINQGCVEPTHPLKIKEGWFNF